MAPADTHRLGAVVAARPNATLAELRDGLRTSAGLTTICRALNLAEPTVKNHVTAILKVLKVSNRTEAVIAVNNLGWKLPTTAKS